MKEYDVIAIGTGSVMSIVSAILNENPETKVAVIDKDEPGGICLTKGCIPTKILLYPAEIIRKIQRAKIFGIDVSINNIDFKFVMERMRELIGEDMSNIKQGLTNAKEIDFYQDVAEFVKPYILKVGNEKIKGKMILLGTGSKPNIPPIKGLEKIDYHTSDTILKINELPKTICIVGGGYIAAEYGHFFSSMGSEVTILGRNSQFLPNEEPEISNLANIEYQKHMKLETNHEVVRVEKIKDNKIRVIANNRETNKEVEITTDLLLIAAGRSSLSDILHPEKSGIKTDKNGWIIVDDYLETTKKNIWALGDANGKYLFKHAANYETEIVYYNAVLNRREKVDYHAIPHAIFSEPEVAGVGMSEKEAIDEFGLDEILIGFNRYQDTGKGLAMAVKDYFVKIILRRENLEILGAHIIGPESSILIQEIINLMYTPSRSIMPIRQGMHIHPSLSEVVERAAGNLMPAEHYHHYLKQMDLEPK